MATGLNQLIQQVYISNFYTIISESEINCLFFFSESDCLDNDMFHSSPLSLLNNQINEENSIVISQPQEILMPIPAISPMNEQINEINEENSIVLSETQLTFKILSPIPDEISPSKLNNDISIQSSQSPIINRPRLRRLYRNNRKSAEKIEIMDEKFNQISIENSEVKQSDQTCIEDINLNQNIVRRKNKNMFIDDEAIVSGDEDSTDEDDDLNLPDDSIVHNTFNESLNCNSSIDMKQFYMESVKSPIKTHGFKIATHRNNMPDVFSQAVLPDVSILEESFINESVVINSEDDELDIAEAIIKQKSEKRKRDGEMTSVKSKKKKKKYLFPVSSDSSQESS